MVRLHKLFVFILNCLFTLYVVFVALWFRLSERLHFPLPLNENFRNEIWKFILSRSCYEYYEIDEDRPTPKQLDRREYCFNNDIDDAEMIEHVKSTYYIYSYNPIDVANDPIRGSCKEFQTRRKLNVAAVKKMSLLETNEK